MKDPPMRRITRVVPRTAPAGKDVFVYGHLFDPSTPEISFGNRRLGFRVAPQVERINENVLRVRVPSVPGQRDWQLAGRTVHMKARRTFSVTSDEGPEEEADDTTLDTGETDPLLEHIERDIEAAEEESEVPADLAIGRQQFTLRNGFRYSWPGRMR